MGSRRSPGGAGRATSAGAPFRNDSRSSRVMTPSGRDGMTSRRSIPRSFASLRTGGFASGTSPAAAAGAAGAAEPTPPREAPTAAPAAPASDETALVEAAAGTATAGGAAAGGAAEGGPAGAARPTPAAAEAAAAPSEAVVAGAAAGRRGRRVTEPGRGPYPTS